MRRKFKLRTETHIIASRMKMYKSREKWQVFIDNQIETRGACVSDAVATGIKPRAVIVKVVYPELDLTQPATDEELFEVPSVTILEISVSDGLILREFMLTLEEAKKLAETLSNL